MPPLPMPHPEPPPLEARRRPCPHCPQYADSLRWTGVSVMLLMMSTLEFGKWLASGEPWPVSDSWQCWWCGYGELIERPQE